MGLGQFIYLNVFFFVLFVLVIITILRLRGLADRSQCIMGAGQEQSSRKVPVISEFVSKGRKESIQYRTHGRHQNEAQPWCSYANKEPTGQRVTERLSLAALCLSFCPWKTEEVTIPVSAT